MPNLFDQIVQTYAKSNQDDSDWEINQSRLNLLGDLIKACLVALGFEFIRSRQQGPEAFVDDAVSDDEDVASVDAANLRPTSWSPSSTYKCPLVNHKLILQLALTAPDTLSILFKGFKTGQSAVSSRQIRKLDINDFLDSSKFPLHVPTGTQDSSSDTSIQIDALISAFVSKSKLKELLRLVVLEMLPGVLPEEALHKANAADLADEPDNTAKSSEKTERNSSTAKSEQGTSTTPRKRHRDIHGESSFDRSIPYGVPSPLEQPSAGVRLPQPIPVGEGPPEFDNEHRIGEPPRGYWPSNLPSVPARNPLEIGADDRNPPPLSGPGVPHSGMYPDFNSPLFAGTGSGDQSGFHPHMPPGSRYDGLLPGRCGGGPHRGGRGFGPGGFGPGGWGDPFM